jgi:hypothetical protein
LRGAGPFLMRPEVSYCEPWQGQNQPPHSPRGSDGFWPSGMQPRWVQMPTMTSHSGFCTRLASVWGSRSSEMSTAPAFLISSGVRWSMKTGWLRHLTVMRWPSWMGARSTSIEERASTSAAGFMLSIRGQITAAVPMPPSATAER